MVRITIGIEEQLDSRLGAYAAIKRGDISQATVDEIADAALTQFLEEPPVAESCRPLPEEDWELETPTGCFHIRGGRAEPAPGNVPAATIAQVLATIYKEVHYADNPRGHREEKGGETKAQ